MDNLLHNVGELPAPDRSAVEKLLGHALQDDQKVYIVALDAGQEPTTTERQAAWAELESILAITEENVRQSGESPESVEQIIDEACYDVRYGKQ